MINSTDPVIAEINAYLSNKWGLKATADSDMDGVVDSDTYPVDAAKSIDVPDFSDAVTAEIGAASGVEAIEGNLALWFDASNADSIEKMLIIELVNGKTYGNDHHISQDTADDRPLLVDKIINNKAIFNFIMMAVSISPTNTGETLNTLFFVYWPDNEISNTTNDPNSSYSGIRF